jgi:small subunit ribosomal protein S6
LTTYEILLMLDPELPEGRGDEIVARTRELIEGGGGTWRSHDPWGRRRLAYEISHKGEGVYHLIVFDAEPDTLAELSRVLKITDGVMRHMAVRHVAGSRTSAPRDELSPSAPAPAPREDDRPREYSGTNVRSQESPHDEDAPEEEA